MEQNKTQNVQFSNTYQAEPKQLSPQPTSQMISNKSNYSMKSLMSRMISCVLTYPSIVNDPETSSVIEERVRKLPKSEVLLEPVSYTHLTLPTILRV